MAGGVGKGGTETRPVGSVWSVAPQGTGPEKARRRTVEKVRSLRSAQAPRRKGTNVSLPKFAPLPKPKKQLPPPPKPAHGKKPLPPKPLPHKAPHAPAPGGHQG